MNFISNRPNKKLLKVSEIEFKYIDVRMTSLILSELDCSHSSKGNNKWGKCYIVTITQLAIWLKAST